MRLQPGQLPPPAARLGLGSGRLALNHQGRRRTLQRARAPGRHRQRGSPRRESTRGRRARSAESFSAAPKRHVSRAFFFLCVLQAIRSVLWQDVFPQLQLWQFFQVNVAGAVEEFRTHLQNGAYKSLIQGWAMS